jgi:hypothetical protein
LWRKNAKTREKQHNFEKNEKSFGIGRNVSPFFYALWSAFSIFQFQNQLTFEKK